MCGKTARTVRREGRPKAFPTPIRSLNARRSDASTIEPDVSDLRRVALSGFFGPVGADHDVDGHPDDKGLAFALEELKFFSREFRIVGVYPAQPFRKTFGEKVD